MNAPLRTRLLAGALLLAALLPGSGLAADAAAPKALVDDALRAPAQRAAPRRLDVNLPEQVSFETGDVQQAAITPDGGWLAVTRLNAGYSELWLRPLDPALPSLPRKLAPALADRLSPALSPDGRLLAFIGTEDDAKGDLYLLDLAAPDAKPQKLTGRDTEDGAPCFAPDGRTLFFHQRLEGETARRIVALDVRTSNSALRVIDTGGDASSPAVSPDGQRLAFVSTRGDGRGDGRGNGSAVYVMALPGGAAAKLTPAGQAEASPRFAPDGSVLFVSGAAQVQSVTLQPVIARVSTLGGQPQALTSTQHPALQPVFAGGRLYFLSTRSGPMNLWALPPEGEIPARPAAELLALAATLAAQTPVDRHLPILA